MTSLYGSTPEKRLGIEKEEYVIIKTVKLLREHEYKVIYRKATLVEDMHDKIDYFLIFDPSTPFLNMLEVPVDVKYAKTYTAVDNNGIDLLKESKAKWLIINNSEKGKENELWWINVKKLRECRKLYPFMLTESYEVGNKSKFIRIFKYVEDHKDFFGNSVKKYNIT